jgi:hypothetical protein
LYVEVSALDHRLKPMASDAPCRLKPTGRARQRQAPASAEAFAIRNARQRNASAYTSLAPHTPAGGPMLKLSPEGEGFNPPKRGQ